MPITRVETSVSAGDHSVDQFRSQLFSQVHRLGFHAADGHLHTCSAEFPDGALKIGSVESTGHRINLTETDDVTLLFPQLGRIGVDLGGTNRVARAGQILALRPGDRLTSTAADAGTRFRALVLMVPIRHLAPLVEGLASTGLGASDGLWLAGAQARRLASATAEVAAGLLRASPGRLSDRGARGMARLLHERIAEALNAAAGDDPVPGTWRGDADLVRTAIRLMRASADQRLSVADLARDLGIGPRRLQLAFQRAGQPSPRDVLAKIRLQVARDRLTRPGTGSSVTDIALDCGFVHLGRFSGQYRQAYGELPSETLARARA